MRVLVNNIAASYGGAMSVLKDFYNFISIDPECRKHQWIILLSDQYLDSTENTKVIVIPEVKKSWIHRLYFDNRTIKKLAKEYNVDCLISLQNTIGTGIDGKNCVYIHQSIPFQKVKKFSFLKRSEMIFAVYQYLIGFIIKRSARYADVVVVQTKWMKNAVSKMASCPLEKIVVANFENEEYLPQDVACSKINCKSFFYPAFHSIYKNQKLIDDACCELESRGITDIHVKLTTKEKYKSSLISSVGRLTRDIVESNYRESVLIFPSYIETIGLPLKEAARCGTIILAADCEYAHETLGDYCNAYFFDPFNATQLADLMQQVAFQTIIQKPSDFSVKSNNGWSAMIERVLTTDL